MYVQSCGVSQDYRWVTNTDNGQYHEEPPIAHQVNHLIDPDAHSIVLKRLDHKLILLVTGLETRDRTDDRHRKIRNSIAWVGENSDDNPVLQALTVQSLRDELKLQIDAAVTSGGKDGFEVKWSDIEKLIPQGISGKKEPINQRKVGNLSDRKKALSDEIAELKYFPDEAEFLVVATEVNSKNGFVKDKVWRGLSSKINSTDEDWEDGNPGIAIKPHKKKLRIVGLIFMLCVIVLLVKVLIFANQSSQIKNQNLRKENQELEFRNQKLKNENKGIAVQLKDKNTQWANLQTVVDNLEKQKRDLEIQVNDLQVQVEALESPDVTRQNQTTRSPS